MRGGNSPSLSPKDRETQLQSLLKLGLTKEQAQEVLEVDRAIDKDDANPFPLTKEQARVSKQARSVAREPKATKPTPSAGRYKQNEAKRFLISVLKTSIENAQSQVENSNSEIEVVNPERQIEFIFQNVKYRIVLSAPRE